MVNKIHLIDPIFKHCRIGTIPNGDNQIEAFSLSSMVRILIASGGYTPKAAADYIKATLFQPSNAVTIYTEFVIVDDLDDNWTEGLPG